MSGFLPERGPGEHPISEHQHLCHFMPGYVVKGRYMCCWVFKHCIKILAAGPPMFPYDLSSISQFLPVLSLWSSVSPSVHPACTQLMCVSSVPAFSRCCQSFQPCVSCVFQLVTPSVLLWSSCSPVCILLQWSYPLLPAFSLPSPLCLPLHFSQFLLLCNSVFPCEFQPASHLCTSAYASPLCLCVFLCISHITPCVSREHCKELSPALSSSPLSELEDHNLGVACSITAPP